MKLEFTKMHGCGNDFIFIDNMDNSVSLDAGQVAWLCDRHFGIGADGVILVEPSPRDECVAYMHYINADGSLAQMCGNGVRCFAKYVIDFGIASPDNDSIIVDTLAGSKPISFIRDEDGCLAFATVNMGEPTLVPEQVPVNAAPNCETASGVPFAKDIPIPSPWGDFRFTMVSMGNPHAVCFIDDFGCITPELFTSDERSLAALDLDRIGAFYESNPVFPEKANIEFAHICDNGIEMRVYERGCGETLACGTGACATGVAAWHAKRSSGKSLIFLRGGSLEIEYAEGSPVFMTGPAAISFTGTVEI